MLSAKAKKTSMISVNNAIVYAVVALLLGWAFGYLIAEANDDDASSAAESSESLADHKHGLYEVEAEVAPTVKVLADEDELGGWNVKIVTENFEFAPQDVNEASEAGTGHAHIWVDGEKIGRVYSNYYHLGSLGDGEHEITVTLNTNMHMDYAVDGEVVQDSIVVTEASDSGDGHSSHGMEEMDDDHTHDDQSNDDSHSHDE